MGLFRRFKASFVSQMRKQKKDDSVVCLKYIVHSELNDQPGPPSVPRRIEKPARSIIKSAYEADNREILPNIKRTHSLDRVNSNTIKQAIDYSDRDYEEPIESKAETQTSTSLDLIDRFGEESTTINGQDTATNFLYTPSTEHDTNPEQSTSDLNNLSDDEEDTPVDECKNVYIDTKVEDKPPVIFMTQTSLTEGEKNVENGEDNYEVNIQTVKVTDEDEDASSNGYFKIKESDEQFHVHVSKKHSIEVYSVSEDDLSDNEEDTSEYKAMGYSSQAASIFFGEDEPPKVTRPRRVILSGRNDGPDEDDC